MAVLAVVEGAGVAHGHAVQTDVELRLDAAAQAVAAAGELNRDERKTMESRRSRNELGRRTTYDVDESREADEDDGEDAHQGAVHPGLDDPSGEGLQGHREELQAAKWCESSLSSSHIRCFY